MGLVVGAGIGARVDALEAPLPTPRTGTSCLRKRWRSLAKEEPKIRMGRITAHHTSKQSVVGSGADESAVAAAAARVHITSTRHRTHPCHCHTSRAEESRAHPTRQNGLGGEVDPQVDRLGELVRARQALLRVHHETEQEPYGLVYHNYHLCGEPSACVSHGHVSAPRHAPITRTTHV